MLRKKPTEKLSHPNRYLFLVTQSPDLIRSITKWESMCSRSLTRSANTPRPWMPSVWGVAYVQVWVETQFSIIPHKPASLRLRLVTAGWHKLVRYDQGVHDRGVLSSILIENGVMIRPAGLGIPEQISRAGRQGDMFKKMMTKTKKDTHVSGRELKDVFLGECLPSHRAEACESFVRWDRDERDRRTASRKAAPAIGSQQVGDIVLCCRESRAGIHELRRNGRSRLTGFEKNKNSLSEGQLRDSKFAGIFLISHIRVCPLSH